MKKQMFALLTVLASLSAAPYSASVAQAAHDHPSVHGMLVVGKDKIFLSHLPMFMSPHDYQVIVEAELSPEARRTYLQDRASHPKQTVYTLVPETFVLPDMIAQPRPFKAQLYRGHFERGGTRIVANLTVRIESVVHFRKFDLGASHPAKPKFIEFGTEGGERFLAHYITAKPDFDQVLELTSNGGRKELYIEHGDLE